MKIVVDINHPAHIHFFKNMINQLSVKGHEILLTASNKDISIRLLERFGFPFIKLGSYGTSLFSKAINLALLDWRMYQAVKGFDPDIFLGAGSIRAAHISKLLKKPCITCSTMPASIWEKGAPSQQKQQYWGHMPSTFPLLPNTAASLQSCKNTGCWISLMLKWKPCRKPSSFSRGQTSKSSAGRIETDYSKISWR
jgi:hypothetical protein